MSSVGFAVEAVCRRVSIIGRLRIVHVVRAEPNVIVLRVLETFEHARTTRRSRSPTPVLASLLTSTSSPSSIVGRMLVDGLRYASSANTRTPSSSVTCTLNIPNAIRYRRGAPRGDRQPQMNASTIAPPRTAMYSANPQNEITVANERQRQRAEPHQRAARPVEQRVRGSESEHQREPRRDQSLHRSHTASSPHFAPLVSVARRAARARASRVRARPP